MSELAHTHVCPGCAATYACLVMICRDQAKKMCLPCKMRGRA